MNVYAVTGVIASGKSTVLNLLAKRGFLVLSADKIYHKLLEEESVKNMLVREFTDEILTDDIVDRKKLGDIVFNDEAKMEKLNSLTHPLISKKIMNILNQVNVETAFVEIPLLFESGMDKYFQKILYITADDKTCTERLMKRTGLSVDEASERVSMSKAEKEKNKEYCSYILHNNNGIEKLKEEVDKFIKSL